MKVLFIKTEKNGIFALEEIYKKIPVGSLVKFDEVIYTRVFPKRGGLHFVEFCPVKPSGNVAIYDGEEFAVAICHYSIKRTQQPDQK